MCVLHVLQAQLHVTCVNDVYLYVGSDLRGQERKHFVVVPLDGAFRVKDMAPSIQAVKKAAADSNGAVAVGLVSMMGFEHTRNELAVSLIVSVLAEVTQFMTPLGY